MEDSAQKFICTANQAHRWTASDEPSFDEPSPAEQDDPFEELADAIADRVARKLNPLTPIKKFFSRS